MHFHRARRDLPASSASRAKSSLGCWPPLVERVHALTRWIMRSATRVCDADTNRVLSVTGWPRRVVEHRIRDMADDRVSVDGGQRQAEQSIFISARRQKRRNHRRVCQSHAEPHASGIMGHEIPIGHSAHFPVLERGVVDLAIRFQQESFHFPFPNNRRSGLLAPASPVRPLNVVRTIDTSLPVIPSTRKRHARAVSTRMVLRAPSDSSERPSRIRCASRRLAVV